MALTNAGCTPDVDSVPAGMVTFEATNDGGDAVDEVELLQGEDVLAETENLAPGLSGSFTVDLEPGSYTLLCPGAEVPRDAVRGRRSRLLSPEAVRARRHWAASRSTG